jgi:hypothetical protein
MRKKRQYRGFSLTEVLLAVGTLAVGMVFISGTFLTGIHFSTIATERTIAAVVADEAFAKVKVYGIDLMDPNLTVNQQTRFESLSLVPGFEFAYPSTSTLTEKHYYWSALCRPVSYNPGNRLVQVTVFISRKVGSSIRYKGGAAIPVPVQVDVSGAIGNNELTITGNRTFINDGYTIIDNTTGRLYRVLERYAQPGDERMILLDRAWIGPSDPTIVWVIPPPVGGGRYPCIGLYQKVIRF